MPIVVGVDAHKKTHTMAALDHLGRRLGERTFPTTTDGHLAAVQWAAQLAAGDDLRFAVEDCRHLTRLLEGDLLRAGQRVVRVPTRLMADARRAVRRPGSRIRSTPSGRAGRVARARSAGRADRRRGPRREAAGRRSG